MRAVDYDLRSLWMTLLVKDLKAKYKNTLLGYAWSVIMPLFQSVVFFFVFSEFLRFPIENYFLFLTIGFVVWQFFNNTLMLGATVFNANRSLVCRTMAPRWIFVAASTGAEAFHLLVTLPVLLFLMFLCGRNMALSGVWCLLAGFISLLLMGYGFALMIGIANACFRDLERIVQLLLMVWFYVTPVFYGIGQVPEKYHWLLKLNCMYYPVELFRSAFYAPANCFLSCILSLCCGVVIAAAGTLVYRWQQKKLAEVI